MRANYFAGVADRASTFFSRFQSASDVVFIVDFAVYLLPNCPVSRSLWRFGGSCLTRHH